MKNMSICVAMALLVVAMSGCGQNAPGPDAAPTTAPTEPTATPPPVDEASSVETLLREKYADFAPDVYIFRGATDLNDDSQDEVVVHVVSPMLCGTGGCNTLVLTPEGSGYRVVADISVTRPPIRVSPRATNGWRNLIVHVSGGGVEAHNAELEFDGTTYPSNPTVESVKPAPDTEGAEVLIPVFETLTDGTRLWTE